jgi:hypothetical protein
MGYTRFGGPSVGKRKCLVVAQTPSGECGCSKGVILKLVPVFSTSSYVINLSSNTDLLTRLSRSPPQPPPPSPSLRLVPHLFGPASRDSTVDIVTCLRAGRLRGRSSKAQQRQDFSHLHVVQTGSGVNPTSCPDGTGNSFPWGEASGV